MPLLLQFLPRTMHRNVEKRAKHEMVHRELRSNQPFNRSLYCLSMPSLAVFLIIAMIIQMNFIRYIFLGILRAAPSESEHFSLPLQVSTPPITSVWPAKATGSTVIAFDANETKSTALRVFSSHNSSSKRTAAIVLFGIPKEFPVIWKHYEDNLIRLNPNVTFSVTIHLYNDVTKLTNLKNNEFDVDIESEDRIAEVLRNYILRLYPPSKLMLIKSWSGLHRSTCFPASTSLTGRLLWSKTCFDKASRYGVPFMRHQRMVCIFFSDPTPCCSPR